MAQFAFNNSIAVIGISSFFANYDKYLNIEKKLRGVKLLLERVYVSV